MINTVWAGSEEALGALEFVDESFQGMVVEKAQTLQAEYKQQQQQPPERRFGILEAALKPAGGTKKDGRLAHAQILAAVTRTFGVEIDVERAFQAFTPENLAQRIEAALVERLEGMTEEDTRKLLER